LQQKLNHGIASLQFCGNSAAKAVFHFRAPETLSPWIFLPPKHDGSMISPSLLAPSAPKEETNSYTWKKMGKNSYKLLEWPSTCVRSTCL